MCGLLIINRLAVFFLPFTFVALLELFCVFIEKTTIVRNNLALVLIIITLCEVDFPVDKI